MKNSNNNWLNDLRKERFQSTARNPGAAALMSFFVMGMGQIYAGHIDRGIMLMGFHFSGIFAAYSLYNNGILYETLFPYLGAHLIIMGSYVVSVIFILLWIYNIKDAYYLSLFASFRDWFEVERVLLPILSEQPGSLLTGPSAELISESSDDYQEEPLQYSQSTAESTPLSEPASESVVAAAAHDAEEADVLEFKIDRKTQPKKLDKRRQQEKSETAQVVSGRDFEAISVSGSSWRLYAGLIAIFMLVGVWFNNRQIENNANSERDATLFTVSADMNDQTILAKIPSEAVAGDLATPPVYFSAIRGNEIIPKTVSATVPVVASAPGNVLTQEQTEPAFMRGLELARNGSFDEAAALFEADLQKAEPNADSWKVVLNTFYRTENKVAYEVNLRRYLKKYSKDSAAWFNLGKLLYDRNELVQAAQAIAGGLKADPDNVRGNFLLGSIYNDLKLFEDSSIYLTRAVNLEPLNLEFNRMLARSLAAAGKVQESVKYYQRVSSLAPDDKEARQAIAAARPEMAMAFQADDTDDNQILVVMGKTESRLIEKNSEEQPVQQMGKILYENPDAGADQENIVVAKTSEVEIDASNKTEAALAKSDVSEPRQSSTPEATETSVTAAVQPDVNPPAKSAAEEVVAASTPQPTENAKTLDSDRVIPKSSGISELEAARTDAVKENNELRDTVAVAAAKAKPAARSSRIEEFRQKGSFEFSRGNWEAALPHYLNILKEKKDPQTYDIVGMIFEKLSMHQDAFDAVEHAYKMGLRDSATLAKLGRLAEVTGDFKKGEYYLYHALQKIPHRVDLRIRYARCLEANGREEIALKELNKIVRASGDSYAVRRRAELEIQKIKSRRQ